jgi:hypothetical protein
MNRAQTFAALSRLPAVMLNLLQDVTAGARPTSHGDLTSMGKGFEVRLWQSNANVLAGALKTVDDGTIQVVDTLADPVVLTTDTLSWTDREVFGVYRAFSSGDQHPGQASDHSFDATTSPVLFWGYLGLGALDAGSANVTAGNPPVPASGASWAVRLDTDVWLYVDGADGALKLYNGTAGTLYKPTVVLFATGKTGKR